MAEIFSDSKTFVDMHVKNDPKIILAAWEEILRGNNNQPIKSQLVEFVEEHFDEGNELEEWEPADYTADPKVLIKIKDDNMRKFAKDVVQVWPSLGRKIKTNVFENPERYSIIPLPNGFIVPGGRFREIYYWDTYWIINGLLLSDMYETVKGMLDNFVHLIKTIGFIPNGTRQYYLNRSQPPLFTSMVMNYINRSNDLEWLRKNIQYLEEELKYWLDNRFVKITKDDIYYLARYVPEGSGPRPESYREDYNIASMLPEDERERFYNDIRGAAESGWDFSSRWFYDEDGHITGSLQNIYTSRSIPVDLNSFLYSGFSNIAKLFDLINDNSKCDYWNTKAETLKTAINKIFWNEEDGTWYDYDMDLNQHRRTFFSSNLTPLWVKAFDTNSTSIGRKVIEYLTKEKVLDNLGGIPTSMLHTGEQWDFPNAWAPLQSIVVGGLENIGYKTIAEEIAKKWLKSNFKAFVETGNFYEKYDTTDPGKYGGGGEYKVQSGFGWTNGVILEFINKYYC